MKFHLSSNVWVSRVGDTIKIEKTVPPQSDGTENLDQAETVTLFETYVDLDSFYSMISLMTGKDFNEVKNFLGGS